MPAAISLIIFIVYLLARFDRKGVGAVKTTQFLKMLGLDEQNNHSPSSSLSICSEAGSTEQDQNDKSVRKLAIGKNYLQV